MARDAPPTPNVFRNHDGCGQTPKFGYGTTYGGCDSFDNSQVASRQRRSVGGIRCRPVKLFAAAIWPSTAQLPHQSPAVGLGVQPVETVMRNQVHQVVVHTFSIRSARESIRVL
jgi:hypothetical protein